MRGLLPLRGWPLSLRLPLLAAALMILVGVAASQLVLSTLGRVQEARLRELARNHVDALVVALGPAVLREDVWEVYDTLDRARSGAEEAGGSRAVLTVVADAAGRVLAATDPRAAPVGSQIAAVAGGAQEVEAVVMTAGMDRVRVLAPLTYQEREVGQVLTELDVTDLQAERARLVRLLLLGNAAATGVIATGGALAVRRMLQPLRSLTRHMEATQGRPVTIPLSAVPHDDPELGRLFGTYNAMVSAVEARAEAERDLAERERYVSLGRLSSSLAHEINNPLGGLLNAADTVRTFADRPEVVREGVALIERGLGHLRDVARAALDQHRLDGEARLDAADLDDLRILIQPEALRRGQTLEWRVAADGSLASLPAAPVRQIALNLLLNGSQAAGEGGQLGLSVERGKETLCLTVRDDGPGLPAAALGRLFGNETGQTGGGLGLRTVRDLVAGLRGRVEHKRGLGATEIVVTLPLEALS